jgi:two-component system, OmpR family, sensor histidine kinase KdpD
VSERPSPEEMLARAAAEARGRLKIFFGAAPGVGKTYAMLTAGLARQAEGVDVRIGWVETHGRADTDALARRLPSVAAREVSYRGLTLREFDLDGALAARPALLLVDELPHTNAGGRHPKRWQDVEELLEAGIDVYTTLNVQHLESLNDVVAQITGVVVRETVPDALFDRADEIALVDLPPADLLARLHDGKVYRGEAAERAADHFFREGNLIALRELALRRSAERVDAQAEQWRRAHGVEEPWPVGDRVLVAVGPSPGAPDLVRGAFRMASRLRAEWIAAAVETNATDALPAADRERIHTTLAFAESLGAEAVLLRGESVADEVVALARARGVTRIVLGRPTHARWVDHLRGSLVDALIRRAGGIDVLVTSGGSGPAPVAAPRPPATWAEWAEALGWVAAASALGLSLRDVMSTVDLAMLQLLAVVVVGTRASSVPSLAAAAASVAAFDILFVPPYGTFAVSDLRYLLTFAVMLGVGVAVSRLTWMIRERARSSADRERRTATLYALTRDLAQRVDPEGVAEAAARHVREHLGGAALVWLREPPGLRLLAGEEDARERAVAEWAASHGRAAGVGTDTLPASAGLYLPLLGAEGAIGVLGVRVPAVDAAARALLDVMTRQVALALERALLAASSERARVAVETERTRNELLSAVSHDLRTPLASITGSASAILEDPTLPEAARRELLGTIRDEGQHLSRLVTDLLDLTRVESGAARRERIPVEEVVEAAVARAGRGLPVRVTLPEEVLVAPMDAPLVTQVLVNLLENATKYAPDQPIDLSARAAEGGVELEVADRGPGVPEEERERIFEKFYRAGDGGRVPGTGLGLAICRAVVRAHGGRIAALPRAGGGARFVVWLPGEEAPWSP